jgi:tripartite-type tricarboxylate transporter receptor subunit TctC
MTKMIRRRMAMAGTLVAPMLARHGWAQSAYPSKQIRMVVPFAPAGTTDLLGRIAAQHLAEAWGQTVIVDNKSGAGGNVGAEVVAHAPPDGYTLLLVAPANAINATLYEKLNYDFIRDIAPVAGLNRFPNVMEVNPAVPAKTVPEFIAHAKANPGKINYASSGNGSTIHMSAELFKMMVGVDLVHVPYRGSAPALTDMLGGQVQVMFDNLPTSLEHIRAGKLRPLAITSATRSELIPDVPTLADFVPGYESSAWYGVGAPKGTPAEIIDKLNKEINATLADPKAKARIAEMGATLITGSPADFGKLVADETEKWGKVVKFSGARAD